MRMMPQNLTTRAQATVTVLAPQRGAAAATKVGVVPIARCASVRPVARGLTRRRQRTLLTPMAQNVQTAAFATAQQACANVKILLRVQHANASSARRPLDQAKA